MGWGVFFEFKARGVRNPRWPETKSACQNPSVMANLFKYLLTTVCLPAFASASQGSEQGDWVELTSTEGVTITARILRFEGDGVVLETQKTSRAYTVPLARLSTESQDFLESLRISPSDPEAATPMKGLGSPSAVPKAEPPQHEFTLQNSLGMTFVPVPGMERVLIGQHEVRLRDYERFAADHSGLDGSWKNAAYKAGNDRYEQGPDHPVVLVTLEECRAFCQWLTEREQEAGRIGPGDVYRLPTDNEWSLAIGIADQERRRKRPHGKDREAVSRVEYPWGQAFPPAAKAGNYYGEETGSSGAIEGYTDAHLFTAPVKSYPPHFMDNELPIFDLGGNVWEFIDDPYSRSYDGDEIRGGVWNSRVEYALRSARRAALNGVNVEREHHRERDLGVGFRVVLELE